MSNQLNIANMTANWFMFTARGGVSMTNYTLFHSSVGLAGSLGADTIFNTSMSIVDGYLFLQGNDVMLQVVPEPSALTLVGDGIAGLLLLRCFRRKWQQVRA